MIRWSVPSFACWLEADVAPLVAGLDTFRGRQVTITALPGGLTNHNVKVDCDGGAYVVRISSVGSGTIPIDRNAEYQNSMAAASSGVGAPVVEYRPGEGILVVAFIDGRTLTDTDVAADLPRVASACRRLHAGPRFVTDFDMFAVRANYLRIVLDNGYRLPAGYLDFTDQAAYAEHALGLVARPTVPCNNDLLPANIIDDGSELRLIDYEYSGNNDPCFELGNLASECRLTDEQLDELTVAYFGFASPAIAARVRLWGLIAHYGWTLWAAIQAATSPVEFDFWSWGMQKYDAAIEAFRGPRYAQLLDEVRRDE